MKERGLLCERGGQFYDKWIKTVQRTLRGALCVYADALSFSFSEKSSSAACDWTNDLSTCEKRRLRPCHWLKLICVRSFAIWLFLEYVLVYIWQIAITLQCSKRYLCFIIAIFLRRCGEFPRRSSKSNDQIPLSDEYKNARTFITKKKLKPSWYFVSVLLFYTPFVLFVLFVCLFVCLFVFFFWGGGGGGG